MRQLGRTALFGSLLVVSSNVLSYSNSVDAVCDMTLVKMYSIEYKNGSGAKHLGNRPITDLRLSSEFLLAEAGIKTLADLTSRSAEELAQIPKMNIRHVNEIVARLSLFDLTLKESRISSILALIKMHPEKKLSQPVSMLGITEFQGKSIKWLLDHAPPDACKPDEPLADRVRLRLIEAGITAPSWEIYGEPINTLKRLPLESVLAKDVGVIFFPRYVQKALIAGGVLMISDLVEKSPRELDRTFGACRGPLCFFRDADGDVRPMKFSEIVQSRLEEIGLSLAEEGDDPFLQDPSTLTLNSIFGVAQ